MSITTTRRLEELRQECVSRGLSFPPDASRADLFDILRAHVSGLTDEIDPMKAVDLRPKIDWTKSPEEGRYSGVADYFKGGYIAEPKYDGVRLRMRFGSFGNMLFTGRRSVKTFAYIDRSDNFPHIRDLICPDLEGTVVDGELLAPSGKIQTHTGTWTDSLLNASVALTNSGPEGAQATQERFGPATFVIFDVLQWKSTPTVEMTYLQRRALLHALFIDLDVLYPEHNLRLIDSVPATVEAVEGFVAQGFEGAMLKRALGVYQPGKRSKEWAKIKPFRSADAFICGFTPGEHANEGLVGSLELAVYNPDGSVRPVAQVGNLTDEYRRKMSTPEGTLDSEFYGEVVEFVGQGVGKNGRVRHANLVRFRPDKDAKDCTLDQMEVFPRV